MAEVRARITCGSDNCSSLEPSMNIEFADVWTDEIAAGRAADPSFSYSYLNLTTEPPTSMNCLTQPWAANCRIVINYETHLHPLWSAPRPVLDADGGVLRVGQYWDDETREWTESDLDLGISAMFWYKLIDLTGRMADYAERVGNRLRLLTAS